MSRQAANALDSYIAFTDRFVAGEASLDELDELFAPNATIRLFAEPVSGMTAIKQFYGGFLGAIGACRHFWNTSDAGNCLLEAEWVAAIRFADGRLLSASGFERARLDRDGRIAVLENYPDRASAPADDA